MSFQDFQKQINTARNNSEAARLEFKTTRQQSANATRAIQQQLRGVAIDARASNEQLAALEKSAKQYATTAAANKTAYADALSNEWAKINEWASFTDPMKNIGSLTDDCPILLFPLRLETRFKNIQRGSTSINQLWVRVFPDDIAINSFESDLSDSEIRTTRAYWLARWNAGKDIDGNRGAWRSLAAAHGPGRAYWLTTNYVPVNLAAEPEKLEHEIILAIATDTPLVEPELSAVTAYWQAVWLADKDANALTQAWNNLLNVVSEPRATTLIKEYKPGNLNELPPAATTRAATVVRVEFVVFAATDELEAKLHAWSQPPTTNILPERFVFLAYQNGEQALPPQLGNLVAPRLILGPDPAAEEGEDFRLATLDDATADPAIKEGDLIFSEHMRWMFDFDDAVAKGMGFKINLTSEQSARGFDRVFVLGMKLGADQAQGQTLVQDLFAQHQTSRKGFSIIKQGTPTNNTEADDSGYSWRQDPDKSFDIYFTDATPDDSADTAHKRDGRWLAELLGLDATKLHSVENYYASDISEAKAMQRALWPATFGHFMDSMMHPVLSKQVIEQTRDFFTRYVSGRGNLPAIRVGKQPYGILPATNYTHMNWFKRSSDRPGLAALFNPGNSFLVNLYSILLDMDSSWMALQQSRVAHVGKAGDAHQILLDIIGLHPDSVELYKRYANSLKQAHNTYNAKHFAHDNLFSYYPTSYISASGLLAKYGYEINSENPEPDIFKKIFFENSYILKGPRIDKVPNTEVDPISIYTPDNKNYISWLINAANTSHDALRQQNGFIDDKPPSALLYLLLYHALDLSYIDTSLKLHLNKGVMSVMQVKQAYVEPDFIHIEASNETESRWKYLYKTDTVLSNGQNISLSQYIAQNIATLDEAAAFRDVLSGLEQLQNMPTASLERAMMEHLDTVSYRYDAWMLGYVHLQLEQMRGLQATDTASPAKQGIYIGAYGWLEDLRPENKVLTPVSLPDDLQALFNPDGDLVEDSTNAGYILAPSLNHAVTAAVLRNGHLSSDNPEDREELKIKLSSQRVRMALQIIEGIQAGQTLAALLGYQFERGLHDRTDVEADEFIFDLRNAFPLVAKKLRSTTPDATADPEYESIDQIEAKNVLDGVAFLAHVEKYNTKAYPFKLNQPPFNLNMPPATTQQQNAINEELLKLIETNNAVADLALAESVHQVVLGNYARAAATLETYSKGNFPPTPDVIKTPRSGTLLTHRVALQFKTSLTHALSDVGVTPRMVAEPALQNWLESIMPALSDIVAVVSFVNRTSSADEEQSVSMQALGLQHIDLLYLLNVDRDQAMSALDDLIVHYVFGHYTPRMDQMINIAYTQKLDADKFSVFEITSLIVSLRALLLSSKPLNASDVKIANETAKEHEQNISLDANRVTPIIAGLATLRTTTLANYISHLTGIIATDNVDNIINELDTLLADVASLFIHASTYGMPQTGIGFVQQWQQAMYTRIRKSIDELVSRWQARRSDFITLLDEYTAGIGSLSDIKLMLILKKAELKIAAAASVLPSTTTPAEYLTAINARLIQFDNFLNNTILPISSIHGLTPLLQSLQSMVLAIAPFDATEFDMTEPLQQINLFANDLKTGAENLSQEMLSRETSASTFLSNAASSGDALAQVEFVKKAAKAIFGDNFVLVPEFTLDAVQGTEWQNALTDSANSLRYLLTDLNMDFPMDDWLYTASRVREKLYHVENTLLHIEGFTGASLSLQPTQFPYREDDYWLGLQFPDKKPGTDDAFTIDEDKLLFTSIYAEPFDPTRAQCGLLLDEWTEVIPSRDETPGLGFHYDQPNSEPPQTLLLVTPSDFTGHWRWDDLVSTLHETLDMAKKRAVEPDHVDTTVYSRFLPPIVSLTSPLPITATLNLALNNQVFFTKVLNND
jgi:hypothetical protein